MGDSLKGVSAECIVNYDETNIVDDPGKKKVIGRRGAKHCYRIMDSSKCSVSVMFSGTASGKLLPPYIVYGAEHIYDTWTQGGPKSALYNRTKSGWFNECTFQDWFEGIALPYFRSFPQGSPKALIGDNLSSHISIGVLEKCRLFNIRFILLPANATHLCQPLDVAYFRPLKIEWRKTLEEWKLNNRGSIPKDRFPAKLKQTLDSIDDNGRTKKNLIAGFRKTGIHPLCAEKVLEQVPQTEEEEYANSNVGNAINQSFEVYMKQLFQKETQPLKKKCKKKLNIPPGKSVENMSFSDDSSREDDPDDKFNGNEEEVTEKASLPRTQALPSATAQERFELKDLKEVVAKFEYHGQKGMKVQKITLAKFF